MTKKQLIEYSLKALEEFDRLPVEEQKRRLMENGTIDANGEVLFGREAAEQRRRYQDQRAADRNGNGSP